MTQLSRRPILLSKLWVTDPPPLIRHPSSVSPLPLSFQLRLTKEKVKKRPDVLHRKLMLKPVKVCSSSVLVCGVCVCVYVHARVYACVCECVRVCGWCVVWV
jgi:hypothetical protein